MMAADGECIDAVGVDAAGVDAACVDATRSRSTCFSCLSCIEDQAQAERVWTE